MTEIIRRYQNQTLSQQIHRNFIDKNDRHCSCLRHQNGTAPFIELFKNPGQTKAYYKGLQTCGSVFACPICAVKITEHRKQEIEELLEITKDFHHYLITLTIPHYADQACLEILNKFMSARRRFKNWGPVKKDKFFIPYRTAIKHYHYDGSVTTVDVTIGLNGWHIHSHELIVLKDKITDLKAFFDVVFKNWMKAVKYSKIEIKNFEAFMRHAVKIDELHGDHKTKMTSYLTKTEKVGEWGISAEMAKGIMKKAENGNMTPFGILHFINSGKDEQERSDRYKEWAPKYAEYCKTFKGHRYIYFSKGLKEKHGINDLTDQEIVTQEDVFKNHYGYFEKSEWQEIKKYRLRGYVIEHSEGTFFELQTKLRNEITLRKAMQNEKSKDQERLFRKTG